MTPDRLALERVSYTQDQFDRLPKWAQREIRTLQMHLRSAKQTLQQMGPQGDSDTVASDCTREWRLPRGSSVRFALAPGFVIQCRHDAENACVHVGACGTIGGRLDIEPRAANLIYARVRQ